MEKTENIIDRKDEVVAALRRFALWKCRAPSLFRATSCRTQIAAMADLGAREDERAGQTLPEWCSERIATMAELERRVAV